jgi:N-methylhydantoinase B
LFVCGANPLDRPPEAVLEDVLDDYVSLERAVKDYGVVIEEVEACPGDYRVNMSATDELRK